MDKTIGDATLMLGDCLERMQEIPDGSVDMVLTSPPYDNLRDYNGNNSKWSEAVWKAVLSDLYRVLKVGGVVVWIVGDSTVNGGETGTSFKQALHAIDCGFNLHDTMIWCKDTTPFHDSVRYYQTTEYMFIFSKSKPKTFNRITDRKNKYAGDSVHGTTRQKDGSTKPNKKGKTIKEFGSRFNYWIHNTEKNSKKYGHPAMMPESLAIDHINSWSTEGDIILDCFMGAATTGAAAIGLNRKFIGIEMDEGYFEICKDRIFSAQKRLI